MAYEWQSNSPHLSFDAMVMFHDNGQNRLRIVKEPIEIDGRVIRPGRCCCCSSVAPTVTSASSTGLTKSISRGHQAGIRASAAESTTVWGQFRSTRMPAGVRLSGPRFGKFEPAGEFVRRSAGPFRTYDRLPLRIKATPP